LVLCDNGTLGTLARYLIDHYIVSRSTRGWEELENGELLTIAEVAGFEVLVTIDRNLPCQGSRSGGDRTGRSVVQIEHRRRVMTFQYRR
jgi:hypothetical protein